MSPDIYFIDTPLPGRLAILSRPRAGEWLDEQISGWRAAGLDTVVSLLEPSEVHELDLGRVPALCRDHGMSFVSCPISDRGLPPSRKEALTQAGALAGEVAAGRSVAVHCRAGIGRSALMAAAILVLLGCEPRDALDLIAKARRVPVPDTDEQRHWIEQMTVR